MCACSGGGPADTLCMLCRAALPCRCKAMAIGSGSEGANTALQEEYKAELSLEEAEVLVLKTLKQVMEEKVWPLW